MDQKVARLTNAKHEDFLKLAGSFDKKLRQTLEKDSDDQMKDAVDSVVANRHLIVHGRTCGISLGRISGYWDQVKKFAALFEKVLLPPAA